jgi:hypothetical protein
MLRSLQNHPHFLEVAYDAVYRLLRPFQRWLKPGGRVEAFFITAERISKGALFGCRMCGQCVLHDTGMTCPMTCPKNLRNGPCGGVRPDGRCEVLPEKMCIWVQAWERSNGMPEYGPEFLLVQPPANHRLKDTSAWINDFHRQEELAPAGWVPMKTLEQQPVSVPVVAEKAQTGGR